jgi:hypothetical protein
VCQLSFQFRTRFGNRLAGFFPTVLNAAQTERNPQHLFHQLLHHTARHPAGYRQVSDQCGQIRSKLTLYLGRQVRLRRLAALRAGHSLALILRDMRFNAGQFGHLVPARFTLRASVPVVIG